MGQTRYETLCNDLVARQVDEERKIQAAEQVATTFRGAFAAFLGIENGPERKRIRLTGLDYQHGELVALTQGGHITLPRSELGDWVFVIDLDIGHVSARCQCRTRVGNDTAELIVADIPHPSPFTSGSHRTNSRVMRSTSVFENRSSGARRLAIRSQS